MILCQAPGGFVCDEMSLCNAEKLLFVQAEVLRFSLQLEQTSKCSLSSSGKQIPQFGVWDSQPRYPQSLSQFFEGPLALALTPRFVKMSESIRK